jgi:hypothetical protein
MARIAIALTLTAACLLAYVITQPADACCPAPRGGQFAVNADQTVIILWDAAKQMQHFIRKASFKTDGDDFGFLVPSPSEPELDESGNDAFPYLGKLTEPEVKLVKGPPPGGGGGCGCAGDKKARMAVGDAAPKAEVKVLQEKIVAGFDAKVLEATSAKALNDWLKEKGYAFSPEIEAWAKPYIDQKWKITALKVAKAKDNKDSKDTSVSAGALRISFKTDRPLFPYREPDYKSAADSFKPPRLLRIFFIADARYQGDLTKEQAWTGNVAWSGKIDAEARKKLLDQLKLPEKTGPDEWWLTEFEDRWPYKVAPADVYFSKAADQSSVKREPVIRYVSAPYPTDATAYALAAALLLPPLWLRWRRKAK